MKPILLLSIILLGSTIHSFSQSQIEFEETLHNFGIVDQNEPAKHVFVFTNTGNEPLILSKVEGSCGCTIPEWPRQPIQPGETSSIRVKYDAKKIGPFNKSVTVQSNAENRQELVLRIKGSVEKQLHSSID